MKKNILIFFTLTTSAIGFTAPLKIGYIDAPPLSYTSEEGLPAGLLPTIAEKAFSKIGIDHKFYNLPVGRVYSGMAKGTLDLFNCATSEIPNTYRGQKILMHMELGVFSIKSAKNINNLKDLKGERIALYRGASASGLQKLITNSESGTHFHKLRTVKSMVKFVKKGRADHLLLYKRMLPDYKKKGFKYTSIKRAECRWAISTKVKGAKELLKLLDANSQLIK